ncbi:MAG: TIGR00289 family protein [Euryarchaeota archaeon]|nr:TIGR00289 family protein [Euryarchaeota archaeon]
MNVGVLFSGGKDSCCAHYKVMENHTISCLISIISKNKESYMFHTPNIALTEMQAEAMNIPLIIQETEGEKEEELKDLEEAIKAAKEKYSIDGVVSGAIQSEYQRSRIERVCKEVSIQSINPLWQMDQVLLLNELISTGFKTLITGVFAYPFDESWLGREIDRDTVCDLTKLQKKYKINPSGEGGEIETFVYDGPTFKKRIKIIKASKTYSRYAGVYEIEKARIIKKN